MYIYYTVTYTRVFVRQCSASNEDAAARKETDFREGESMSCTRSSARDENLDYRGIDPDRCWLRTFNSAVQVLILSMIVKR